MVNKNFYVQLLSVASLILLTLTSCRQEAFLADQQQNLNESKYKTRVLDQEEFSKKKELSNKILDLKTNVFKQNNNIASKNSASIQDSILEGAVIETFRVLEITEGSNVTYTFPVSRTFPNNKIENLVLTKNADNTYTGVLMQYQLTEQERQQYHDGLLVDFDDKIKVFPINNIGIASKPSYTYSYYEGCWEYVYEVHPCGGSEGHSYTDGSCPLIGGPNAAQPTTIIAAYNNCDNGGGSTGGGSTGGGSTGGGSTGGGSTGGGSTGGGSTGGGSTGGGSTGGGSTGGGSTGGGSTGGGSTNPYNTYLFMSFDDMYLMCAEGDTMCVNDWNNKAYTVNFFMSLGRPGWSMCGYTPIFDMIKSNITSSNPSPNLSEGITLVGNWFNLQDNTTNEKALANHKFAHWALNYFLYTNPNALNYYQNNPLDFDIIKMEGIEGNDYEFANESANVITDILINQQNNTLNNLDLTWPSLEELKQKVKQAISYGVYTTAKYTRNYLYNPMAKLATKYPSTITWSNKAIDKVRIDAVTPIVNFNPDTMQWRDLFNIWLFELTPNNFPGNNINFTGISNIVSGNNIYNPSTNAVKNFPKGNGNSILNMSSELANGLPQGGIKSGYFTYNVDAFYSTLSNANLGIQMLGSFPITGYVLSKSSNSAVVQFTISNSLGWESGTRFIKGQPGQGNQGIIPNKPVGSGLHLGGTITNNFTWTETISF